METVGEYSDKGLDEKHHYVQVSGELMTQSRISRIVTTNRHMITVRGHLIRLILMT
jgi:hypothetical protein